MDGDDRLCSVEECGDNRDGHCARQMDGPMGIAASALYMPGQTNFMAPFGPAIGNTTVQGLPPMTDAWRNCPRRKESEKKE